MMDFKGIFKKIYNKSETSPSELSSAEAFKGKLLAFQLLLEKNNHALEVLADMQEKMSGDYLFDRHYIDTKWRLISENVLGIIENLNILSQDKYSQLYKRYDEINKDIEQFSSRIFQIPVSALTIPIEELNRVMANIAGGKMANIGEINSLLHLPTPEGFAITAYSFKRFMEHNNFSKKINEKLASLAIEKMQELDTLSKEIQDMVIQGEIPDDLENAIKNAVEGLKVKVENSSRLRGHSPPLMVSVRSSAMQEDGEFSFSGQYATFLNVPEDLVVQRYKEVIASLFTSRAIYYYKTKGFSEEEMVMAVGVLRMVDALTAGVIYTRDPNDPEKDSMIINAVWGLGKAVVDGLLESDAYVVSRKDGSTLQQRVAVQQTMLVCSDKGAIEGIRVPEEMKDHPCLTADQIKALCSSAMLLEDHYGSPQDIEWAIDRDNRTHILQSRPLRVFSRKPSAAKLPTRIEKYNILLDKGIIACKGIGCGKAFILKDEESLKDFPDGAVLIARQANPKFVTVMNKASAIISDIGCATQHVASIAREYQVPTILDMGIATSTIKDGQEITVDAINCNVYDGRVEELLTFAVQRSTFKDTHLFKTLEQVLKGIAPLSLTDPADENFKPEYCKTLHDITRFAHEKAMHEMFVLGGDCNTEWPQTIALAADMPFTVRLLDIDGGIKEHVNMATAEDILSIPFSAMLRGMRTMSWPKPRSADVIGIVGMMARAATLSEEQLYKTGEHSFALVSKNYMNFSLRLGYHFSLVESYVSKNINDNYIKFFFNGGGAAADRRLRRLRLIKETLKKMDFRVVQIKEDVLNATLVKYKQQDIEKKLVILGKFTAYTKQLDMLLDNDNTTDWYIEEFEKDHMTID